jgi:hypothetical protein
MFDVYGVINKRLKKHILIVYLTCGNCGKSLIMCGVLVS